MKITIGLYGNPAFMKLICFLFQIPLKEYSRQWILIQFSRKSIPHFSEGKYSGAVFVKGKDVANTPIYKISEDVGSVFQNPKTQFFNLDSNSELVFGMENLGVPPEKINVRMKEVTHDLGIENLMGRSVFDLSGGEKQILALASIYA